MTAKRTELTVESLEVLVTTKRHGLARSWCSDCGGQVAVISLNDAPMAGLSAEAIQHQADNGRLHLIETPGRSLLICLNRLIQI